MGQQPVITFVVPCYDPAAYMDRCLASVVEEAGHPGLVRAIYQENGGPGEAINTGLAQARGTYFKFN